MIANMLVVEPGIVSRNKQTNVRRGPIDVSMPDGSSKTAKTDKSSQGSRFTTVPVGIYPTNNRADTLRGIRACKWEVHMYNLNVNGPAPSPVGSAGGGGGARLAFDCAAVV